MSEKVKQIVRERANYACEYCGVTERNAGGELTIDHFRPQSKGGTNELENLVYCCPRCNLYKSDFWVEPPTEPSLWNPRSDVKEDYFWQADDGRLYALNAKGELSLRILNLNRPQLVAYRLQQRLSAEERQMLEELETALEVLSRLGVEQSEIIRAQQVLLDEQRRLLKLLLEKF